MWLFLTENTAGPKSQCMVTVDEVITSVSRLLLMKGR